jgi:hypothetical protein
MSEPPELRTLSATCHCTSSTLTFTLPVSFLPLPVHFCHCTDCFKTHGTLISTHAPIPPPAIDFTTLTSYKSSELVRKWFCTTCGAHFLDRVEAEGGEKWFVTVSLVDIKKEEEDEVWKYIRHIFVGDTRDGGIADKLEWIDGKRLTLWDERQRDDEGESGRFGEQGERALWQQIDDEKELGDEKLTAACHCGSVSFSIDRRRELEGAMEVGARDTSKWPGRHCACNSCRLTSSSFITSWVSVAISAITVNDRSMDPEDKLFGLGTVYQSSKGRTRIFCHVCGSSVSYIRKEKPGILEIAAGLLEGKGAMVSNSVEWRTEADGKADARMNWVVEALQKGLNAKH